jgi:uncharacterized protein YkwD
MTKFLFSLLFLTLLGFFIFYFWPKIEGIFTLQIPEIKNLPQKIEEITKVPEVTQKEEKEISPPPLKVIKEGKPEVILTQKGIIEWTNKQREKYGLAPLKENQILDETAMAKVEDMFENQYFAHESPTGEGVSDLARKFSYDFLLIGENLAMGNFSSDEDLVLAWMESPGHRENILNEKYQEIGVAVKKGIFEGKEVWIAVQHFGLPSSFCQKPDLSLKEKIEENEKQIFKLQEELLTLNSEIRKLSRWQREEISQKIDQYNELVSEYNSLVAETKNLIDEYNSQVNSYNQCLSEVLE